MIERHIPYKDKEGNEIDLMTWGKLFEDSKYRQIAKDKIGHYTISTVWIGIAIDPAYLFETMVFRNGKEVDCSRYESPEEAKQGHESTVNEYLKKKEITLRRLRKMSCGSNGVAMRECPECKEYFTYDGHENCMDCW